MPDKTINEPEAKRIKFSIVHFVAKGKMRSEN